MENLRGWSQTEVFMPRGAVADSTVRRSLSWSALPPCTALHSSLESEHPEFSAPRTIYRDAQPFLTGQSDLMLLMIGITSSLQVSLHGLSNPPMQFSATQTRLSASLSSMCRFFLWQCCPKLSGLLCHPLDLAPAHPTWALSLGNSPPLSIILFYE